jgi:Flp pilus assembly pilin Flp
VISAVSIADHGKRSIHKRLGDAGLHLPACGHELDLGLALLALDHEMLGWMCGRERRCMSRELRRFLLDQSGPELVEWALVTVVLLLATGLILVQIYDEVLALMQSILMELTQ